MKIDSVLAAIREGEMPANVCVSEEVAKAALGGFISDIAPRFYALDERGDLTAYYAPSLIVNLSAARLASMQAPPPPPPKPVALSREEASMAATLRVLRDSGAITPKVYDARLSALLGESNES